MTKINVVIEDNKKIFEELGGEIVAENEFSNLLEER